MGSEAVKQIAESARALESLASPMAFVLEPQAAAALASKADSLTSLQFDFDVVPAASVAALARLHRLRDLSCSLGGEVAAADVARLLCRLTSLQEAGVFHEPQGASAAASAQIARPSAPVTLAHLTKLRLVFCDNEMLLLRLPNLTELSLLSGNDAKLRGADIRMSPAEVGSLVSHCPKLQTLRVRRGELLTKSWPRLRELRCLDIRTTTPAVLAGMGAQGSLSKLRTLHVDELRSGRTYTRDLWLDRPEVDADEVKEVGALVCGLAERLPALTALRMGGLHWGLSGSPGAVDEQVHAMRCMRSESLLVCSLLTRRLLRSTAAQVQKMVPERLRVSLY